MPEMTGADAIVETLRALGVRHVFGIVSVHNLPIFDAIARDGHIRLVPTRHEQGAVHAADGYARATGRLGVAVASTGPGCANAVPGLFEASFASSPVLLLTGQVESAFYGKGKGVLHEAERQLLMLQAVTRQARSVRATEEIPSVIVSVATDVLSGRPQPGAVEIPIDLQYRRADVDLSAATAAAARPGLRTEPDPAGLDTAAEALATADRPLLWAGAGVLRAGASSELVTLAERLGAPVATSVNGRGSVPEDHPLCLGALLGTTGSSALAEVLSHADVVLAVGSRFQASATRQWSWSLPGRLIHVDADPGVIGRNYPAHVALVGDAELALSGLLGRLGPTSAARAAERAGFAARAAEARDAARWAARRQIGADHAGIMDTIRELLPRDGIVVRDATVPAYLWGDRLLPVYEPGTSIHPTSAAIGPGLALSVGAAVGTNRRTVLIQGDGGLMLSIGELATAMQEALPLVVCVFNDRGYGVLRSLQAGAFDGRQTGVNLTTPDFVEVADSIGMRAEPVATLDAFQGAFKRAVEAEGPTLIEIDMASLPLAFTRRA